MRRKRANGALESRKRVAEIEKKTQNDDEISKPLVKEAENIELGTDSLFRESWREDLSSSKIAKLMEQRIREAAGAGVPTKPGKLNSVSRTFRKFEINEITAG